MCAVNMGMCMYVSQCLCVMFLSVLYTYMYVWLYMFICDVCIQGHDD